MSADTLFKSLMQISVPNKDRGTAMGSWVLSIGTAPLGHLGLGAIGNIWGSPFGFLFNGIINFLTLKFNYSCDWIEFSNKKTLWH